MEKTEILVLGQPSESLYESGEETAAYSAADSSCPALPTPLRVLNALLSARTQAERCTIAQKLTYDADYSPLRSALTTPARHGSPAYVIAKRCLDIAVASTLLLALFPLSVMIAGAVLLDSGLPILYYQQRVGLRNQPFRFYKFRSMIRNADALKKHLADRNEATGPLFKMRNDPRVTRIGAILRRTSLDELPQLVNVLRGELSLIGPRPLVMPEAVCCNARQQLRHGVQPGLLCLREISGRSALSFDEWMELDLLYVANQSFLTDIHILVNAVSSVLCGSGAY